MALCLQFYSAQTKHQDLLSQDISLYKAEETKSASISCSWSSKGRIQFFSLLLRSSHCTIFPYQCQKRFACFYKITIHEYLFMQKPGLTRPCSLPERDVQNVPVGKLSTSAEGKKSLVKALYKQYQAEMGTES